MCNFFFQNDIVNLLGWLYSSLFFTLTVQGLLSAGLLLLFTILYTFCSGFVSLSNCSLH